MFFQHLLKFAQSTVAAGTIIIVLASKIKERVVEWNNEGGDDDCCGGRCKE